MLAAPWKPGPEKTLQRRWRRWRAKASLLPYLVGVCLISVVTCLAQTTGNGAGDEYEVDDTPAQASIHFGTPQSHTLHSSEDVDWVRFYAASSTPYSIRLEDTGGDIDVKMDIYEESANGSLTLLGSINAHGPGGNEQAYLNAANSGFHLLRVEQATGAARANANGYVVNIVPHSPTPILLVAAFNWLDATSALPSGSYAVLRSRDSEVEIIKFFRGEPAVPFDLRELTEFEVEVVAPDPFWPNEDPTAPGQVENPDNPRYGNPRLISVPASGTNCMGALFAFTPHIQVSGQVEDLWVGAPLSGAAPVFLPRSAPEYMTNRYDRYPVGNYGEAWKTDASGGFPTNVFLPALEWDLEISRDFYHTGSWTYVANKDGDQTNVGVRLLEPVDDDDDGLPDFWEKMYFHNSYSEPGDDADGDGMSNRDEMLAGTNPTNRRSCLRTENIWTVDGQHFMSWQTKPGRRYRLHAFMDLMDNTAPGVYYGPWRATVDQETQLWQIPDSPDSHGYYRLEVLTPEAAPPPDTPK